MGNVVSDGIAAPQEASGDQPHDRDRSETTSPRTRSTRSNEQINASVHLADAPLTSRSSSRTSRSSHARPGKNKIRIITGGPRSTRTTGC